jgi:methylenetetrahydrofolate--tRNA-(uracil-5-)-methyltransferase
MQKVNIIGAGLAGSEACWQLARRNIPVRLYEMRPKKLTEAHKTGGFAELICSNSLRANGLKNAVGVLKEEMTLFHSIIMEAALATQVEAGGGLAVDRDKFSEYITKKLKENPNVEVIEEEVTEIPDGPTIIASGPLTTSSLHDAIGNLLGNSYLYFYDAEAPIVTYDSIDLDKVFFASRYDKGTPAYINCPMTKEEFSKFYDFLIHAEKVVPHDFEMKVFEGCMPIEDMAARGEMTLTFGPMKPVGLDDPRTGRWPYAVVQLRQDNIEKTLYNIVGFQTHLKFGEQKKLLALIPGLENANIMRYGVMHRNTYINSPGILNEGYQVINHPEIFFAGQMTGVEGYVESSSSGIIAGINMARFLAGKPILPLDSTTATGSLACYISNKINHYAKVEHLDPMKANFGIFAPVPDVRHKKDRKEAYANRAIDTIKKLIEDEQLDQ